MNKFQRAISAAMKAHNLRQQDLAKKAKTTSSNISRITQEGQRPGGSILKILCGSAWPDAYTGFVVAQAWLEDEWERIGSPDREVRVVVKDNNPKICKIDNDLRELAQWLPNDVDMQALVGSLADIARREKKSLEDGQAAGPSPMK